MADNKKPGGGQPFSIPVSGVGPEQARRLRVPQHFRYDNSLATISNQYGDGWAVIDMPVGNYCYRQFNLSVTNTVPIASVTGLVGGRNIVFTADLATYINRVQIEIDGKVEQDFFISELIDFNKLMNWDMRNGLVNLCFGSPGWFKSDLEEDAYLLGTANLRSVRILVQLKAAWLSTMRLNCGCEFAQVMRPVGYLVTMRRTRYSTNAAGYSTVSDLPHGIDMAAIWVRSINAIGVNNVQLDVDTETVFMGHLSEFQNLAQIWGKDYLSLPVADIWLDFWREQDAGKGLASLSLLQQIRRNAQIRLSLDFAATGAEYYVLTFHCGPYSLQR